MDQLTLLQQAQQRYTEHRQLLKEKRGDNPVEHLEHPYAPQSAQHEATMVKQANYIRVRFPDQPGAQVLDNLSPELLEQFKKVQKHLFQIKHAELKPEVQLQPHQQRILDKLEKAPGIILYHGLGSGKTLSAIAASQGKPTDVITPAALRTNFAKEVEKHTKNYSPNIRSYEGVVRNPQATGKVLVVDEAHLLGNASTKRAKTITDLKTEYDKRILLTGTPITNKPHELATLINIARGEKALPTNERDFNAKFIKERLKYPGFIGMLKGVKPGVVPELKNKAKLEKATKGYVDYHAPSQEHFPAVTNKTIKVEMGPEQIKYYNYALDKAGPALAYKIKRNLPPSKAESSQLNAFLQAGRQVSNTPASLGGPDQSNKLDTAVTRLLEQKAQDPNFKALVYSNYLDSGVNAYAKRLDKAGISYATFSGGLSDKERKQIVEKYNTGQVNALLVSGAGSQGLDLKGTKLIQLLEPHWHETRTDQVTGRGIRYKSHEHLPEEERKVIVESYQSVVPRNRLQNWLRLKGPTSVDEYLQNTAQQKQQLNQQFLDVLKK